MSCVIHGTSGFGTIFRITAGLWCKFYIIRQFSECLHKLFEEGCGDRNV
jgi:hypothetical protein